MKLMSALIRLSRFYFLLILIALIFSTGLVAQTKKSSSTKKPVAKKAERSAKDARKDSKSKKEKVAANSKNSKKSFAKEKSIAKVRDGRKDNRKDNKNERLSARDKKRLAELDKKDSKKSKESKKAEAARRRAEEERRQAILAEQRRREEAARQARLRQIAFENGLRTETAANISKDKIEGEDLQVRQAAVNALGTRAGTVVVMEAQTGKIVTIVNQDWAIRNGFKPCSTVKLVTGVAGLSERIINEEGGIGQSTSGLTLDAAIARSNNQYFQRVGSNLGNSKMIAYAKTLGLGEQTGINADGETSGRLPYGNNNARIYSHGDDFEVTPLQLAVLVSAISNGGKRVVPQIAKTRFDSSNFRSRVKRNVDLPQQDLEGMIPGMIGAAEWGTAHRGVDASLGIAGKTGSCIGKGSWVGLFASVAPVENPKYAVVVITRGQGERGKYAAAVAGRIYDELRPRINQNRNDSLRSARFKNKAKPDTSNMAVADEDERDDEGETMDSDGRDGNPVVGISDQNRSVNASKPTQKSLITKIVKSQPKFPPVVITYSKDGSDAKRPRVVKNK